MFRNEVDQGWKIKNAVIEEGFIPPIIPGHAGWRNIASTDLPPQDAFYLTLNQNIEGLGYMYADFSTGNVGPNVTNNSNSNCN